ncbi:MAG: hypothetical protein COZ46_04890 [Verrucomicrobia bacterium CG_4_10_14_3_um_filter_43_23]|nr:MAG: hypothetical protein AUJ82_04100 [Verrucomicrobia bacterium CG1_02_43_26]PIP59201.1 MAG: hypothetical protein COX01_04820 [Verrucomicrobia bacterium CG22_combo_CG10-13_8_21_14_all_43_17]PIX58243.1 MAG: hypothetical protein COZ46_04890 [Verrucomicrobia bacterium CG_4_10_14_3_um_filter_43_23]PIY62964.1 MAG: hypothetical protein COY94_00720 [Verrucomicrobia bacterium CG_4_10_14_0_8_um_filter_43_34]PJA43668.1 MAG: hypothetical protein CO175_06830 [Verrucomicrobia bacterium CG_4_9_14_3_um_fi
MNNIKTITTNQKPSEKYIKDCPHIKDGKFTTNYKTGEGFWQNGGFGRTIKWFAGVDEKGRKEKYINYLCPGQTSATLTKESIFNKTAKIPFNKLYIKENINDLWEMADLLACFNASKDQSDLKHITDKDLLNSFNYLHNYLEHQSFKIDGKTISIENYRTIKQLATKNAITDKALTNIFDQANKIKILSPEGKMDAVKYFVDNQFANEDISKFCSKKMCSDEKLNGKVSFEELYNNKILKEESVNLEGENWIMEEVVSKEFSTKEVNEITIKNGEVAKEKEIEIKAAFGEVVKLRCPFLTKEGQENFVNELYKEGYTRPHEVDDNLSIIFGALDTMYGGKDWEKIEDNSVNSITDLIKDKEAHFETINYMEENNGALSFYIEQMFFCSNDLNRELVNIIVFSKLSLEEIKAFFNDYVSMETFLHLEKKYGEDLKNLKVNNLDELRDILPKKSKRRTPPALPVKDKIVLENNLIDEKKDVRIEEN